MNVVDSTAVPIRGVFIESPYALSRITGVGSFVTDLTRKLEELGIRVTLAYPGPLLELDRRSESKINLRLPIFKNAELALKTLTIVFRARCNFDVAHVQHIHLQSATTCVLGRILNKPTVLTLHGFTPQTKGFVRGLNQRLIRWFSLRFANAIVAVSGPVASAYRRPDISTIQNGVDTNLFRPFSRSERERARFSIGVSDEILFLFAGRLARTKGVATLIEACSLPALAAMRFKVLLVGAFSDDEPEFIADISRRIRGNPNVEVVGPVQSDLVRYLNAADVFVLPSFYEGMPLGLLQAMSCGVPVLASDIPVHRDILGECGCGWTFRTADPEDLARLMLKILTEGIPPSWREKARTAAVVRYDLRRVVSNYLLTYSNLLHPQEASHNPQHPR